MIQAAERDKTCQKDNLPQQILLRPNELVEVGWFNLAAGANSLYDDDGMGAAGRQGHLDGSAPAELLRWPLTETNRINFVVVP